MSCDGCVWLQILKFSNKVLNNGKKIDKKHFNIKIMLNRVKNRASKMIFFWWQGIFSMIFDFKNGCKTEFKDNNEKSCS